MLFLILSVTLISVLGFALLRHWKTRKYKKTLQALIVIITVAFNFFGGPCRYVTSRHPASPSMPPG